MNTKPFLYRSITCASRNMWPVLLGIPLLFGTSGCSFRSPSVREQEYLLQQGAFPGGTPDWVVAGNMNARHGNSLSGGLIPQSFTPAEPLGASRVTGARDAEGSAGGFTVPSAEREQQAAETRIAPSGASALSERSRVDLSARPQKENDATVAEAVVHNPTAPSSLAATGDDQPAAERSDAVTNAAKETDGPLQRLERLCPNLEKEAVQALQISDLGQRIKAYERLAVQCPTSPDLWLWLGKDYDRGERMEKAQKCYQKVLALEPANAEAKQLLAAQERRRREAEQAELRAERRRLDEEELEAAQQAATARRRRTSSLLHSPGTFTGAPAAASPAVSPAKR